VTAGGGEGDRDPAAAGGADRSEGSRDPAEKLRALIDKSEIWDALAEDDPECPSVEDRPVRSAVVDLRRMEHRRSVHA
jgi:hypothetical protein